MALGEANSTLELLTNTTAVTRELPSFLAEPVTFLAGIVKFLLVWLGLYVIYLIIMLIIHLRRNVRIKRVERKVDLILKKLDIKTDKEEKGIKNKKNKKDKKKTKKEKE